MKKQYIMPLIGIAAMAGFAFTRMGKTDIRYQAYVSEHGKNSSGAPSGMTGAPGENNCASCHSGGSQDGNAVNSFVLKDADGNTVTSYIPGETYDATFVLNTSATVKGFQTVALTSANTQAGTMTAVSGSTNKISGSRQYITHNSASNTTTSGWKFKWTAPAANAGNVRFYAASNSSNGNGASTGDVIYLSNYLISYNQSASLEETAAPVKFSAFYDAEKNAVSMKLNSLISGEGFFNLVDLSGKSVYNERLGTVFIGNNEETVLLPSGIRAGMYIVHLFVNNQSSTFKIMVGKP